ncbi:MAG: hypothetical protein PHY40_04100 [Patescibacteria group bacterium]|nr:hypothetical protein [Patescibacteria group bacterium]
MKKILKFILILFIAVVPGGIIIAVLLLLFTKIFNKEIKEVIEKIKTKIGK